MNPGGCEGMVRLVVGWRSVGFPVELGSWVVRKGFDAGGLRPFADAVLMWFFFGVLMWGKRWIGRKGMKMKPFPSPIVARILLFDPVLSAFLF